MQLSSRLHAVQSQKQDVKTKMGKKGVKIVINQEKYGRIVTPKGNQERAMKNMSLLEKSREGWQVRNPIILMYDIQVLLPGLFVFSNT